MDFGRLKDIKIHGWGKVLHIIVMGLTYPLRHFFKFLAFLLVFIVILMAIPMMFGVSYKDIPSWYLLRYDETKASEQREIQPDTSVKTTVAEPENIKEVSAPKVVHVNSPATAVTATGSGRRQAFKKVEAEPMETPRRTYQTMKINSENEAENPRRELALTIAENVGTAEDEKRKPAMAQRLSPEDDLHYRKIDTLPLVYEDNPQKISGQTFVFSANEMSVGDTYIILYGVYTDPRKYDQAKAHQYMKELADGKMMVCRIVAYTYQNMATAICFLDGRNVNQNLVDAGFADNVAL